MKSIFILLFVFQQYIARGQDTVNIPTGVVYKKATVELNNKAIELLKGNLNAKVTKYSIFEGILHIGPLLWKRYQHIAEIKSIRGGDIEFKVPSNGSINIQPGKLIQNDTDFVKVWNQVKTDLGKSKIQFRKLNYFELKYYWSVIYYDIEEPVLIAETNEHKFLFQFIQKKMKLLWLDEIY